MTHINNPQIGDGLVAALCRGKCIYKIAVDHCLDCERIMSPPFIDPAWMILSYAA